ncbi:MAG: ABC transporter substrate-binding protein [Desulfovibrionales bacterium]|nr:ABC transporter substrate-binding protein [Desulfovibrionales bacterium]
MKIFKNYLSVFFCMALVMGASKAWASKATPPLISFDALVVGEQILDISSRLGYAPKAFVGRYSLWEDGPKMEWVSQRLGCPVKVCKKAPRTVPKALEKIGLHHLIVQKGPQYCLYKPVAPPCVLGKLTDTKGLVIDTVDFSKGLSKAVLQTATLLGCPDKAPGLMETYEKEMAMAKKNLAKVTPGKRVVILSGTFQKSTGKTFLRVEASGGYSDQYMLSSLSAENVGDGLGRGRVDKGFFTIRKLAPLVKINPDIIVILGDGVAVQKALNKAIVKTPALAKVKALANHAVYSLPFYTHCAPLSYPAKLNKWACMFR